ncbi:hypothetical protein DN621_14885 [Escherichia coli]|nr:hypothetical protein [Escherichia coli]EFN9370480.1 hypothetical protein [Escherichia coli]EFN9375268.1 hypothetical protein [Escherichia coli]EFN9380256.1 hypothetical protein [Escherichia coli]EFN9390789.1 hypothetical protein [Escherichia coli]
MKYRTRIKRKMPYAGCRYRVFIGKLCVIVTLPSVIRKRRTGIIINIISLGTRIFYKKYDELNIIFFYKDYMRLKKSAVKTDFFKR